MLYMKVILLDKICKMRKTRVTNTYFAYLFPRPLTVPFSDYS